MAAIFQRKQIWKKKKPESTLEHSVEEITADAIRKELALELGCNFKVYQLYKAKKMQMKFKIPQSSIIPNYINIRNKRIGTQQLNKIRHNNNYQVKSNAISSSKIKDIELSPNQRVHVLSEALPYLQKFSGKTFVVKYGGAAMKEESLKMGVIRDIVLLSLVGVRSILVHGGGPEITTWLTKLGIKSEFKNGLRITNKEVLEVVEMVLAGKVNKSLVSLINDCGGKAIGISGRDGNLLIARQIEDKDLGYIGEITKVNSSLIDCVIKDGFIPVVATLGTDGHGQAFNINADTAAGEIASSLNAEKLILMTDVPGILKEKDDINTLYRTLNLKESQELCDQNVVSGGMIPKVQCCINSLKNGVGAAHIIDGRSQHSLLIELLTDQGVGTMIKK